MNECDKVMVCSANSDHSVRGICCVHLEGTSKTKAAASYNINNRYRKHLSYLGLLDLGEGRKTSRAVQQIVKCKFLTVFLIPIFIRASSIVTNISKKQDVSEGTPFSSSGDTAHLSAVDGRFRNLAFVLNIGLDRKIP
jgi:hypothetical protein